MGGWTEDWAEFVREMSAHRERVNRIEQYRLARIRDLAQQAGLEPCNIHNALVGLHYGQPWPGVDYSRVRQARRLMERLGEAERVLDRWYARKYTEFVASH